MKSHQLNETFWRSFAKTYWEEKSIVVKNIDSELRELDQNEVFKLLVAASDQSRRDKAPLGFKFFVNGIRSSDVETMFVLPKRSDLSLLGYHERMERIYQDYCLVCDELLQVNQDKQAILNRFTRDLYKQTGFPNRFAEMGLYLGNYRKTPFGVHIDRCGVFSFPVIGEKKFRVWSSDYVAKHPDLEQSFRYAKHKEKSQLLTAEPGDMSYWPSSAWHIAESNGKFSATWSLGVWVDRTTNEVASEIVSSLLKSKLGELINEPAIHAGQLQNEDGEVKSLPKIFEEIISSLKDLTKEELINSFTEIWMKRLSSHGMKTLPRTDGKFQLSTSIKLRHIESPILWSMKKGATSVKPNFSFSFAGNDPMNSRSKHFLKLLKDLNHGRDCKIDEYLLGATRASDLTELKLLGDLGAFADTRSAP